MSKFTGTVAFIMGVLLVLFAIGGIFVKEKTAEEKSEAAVTEMVVKVTEAKIAEEKTEHQIPNFLKISMYFTLIFSSIFVIFHVNKYGLTNHSKTSSTIAFVGGILLVSLGFLSTLAQNEAKFISKQEAKAQVEMNISLETDEVTEAEEGHHSQIPDTMRYTMTMILFIGGILSIFHVWKYGLA